MIIFLIIEFYLLFLIIRIINCLYLMNKGCQIAIKDSNDYFIKNIGIKGIWYLELPYMSNFIFHPKYYNIWSLKKFLKKFRK